MKLGAIHALSGRQWELDKSEAWPDLEIVLPFSRRVIDNTGTIIGPPVSADRVGGYDVVHTINKVEILDLNNGNVLPNVKGVWAAMPGGEAARIHLLGRDPYSWLVPHVDTIKTAGAIPAKFIEQNFDFGQAETFSAEKRFGEVLVKPKTSADLIVLLQPYLTTRIMKCDKFTLSFRTLTDASIHIDQLSLLIVGKPRMDFFDASQASSINWSTLGPICGDLNLFSAQVALIQPVDSIIMESKTKTPSESTQSATKKRERIWLIMMKSRHLFQVNTE